MIALTGVTGKLGGQLASRLSQAGVSARMLARRPEAVDLLANMQIFEAYYDASQTTLYALAGVDILFMVSGREAESRIDEHKALIDAAKLAGVRHIIYTGFTMRSRHRHLHWHATMRKRKGILRNWALPILLYEIIFIWTSLWNWHRSTENSKDRRGTVKFRW